MSNPPVQSQSHRWPLVASAVVGLLIFGCCVGYSWAVRKVRSELTKAAQTQLHANWRDGGISVRLPLNVVIRDANLTRAGGEGQRPASLRIRQVEFRLAEIPKQGNVRIASVRLDDPELTIGTAPESAPAAVPQATPSAAAAPPKSQEPSMSAPNGTTRIEQISVRNGSMHFDPSGDGRRAIAIRGLNADVRSEAGGARPFELSATSDGLKVNADGSFAGATQTLTVQKIEVEAVFDPAPQRPTILPASVASAAREARARGVVHLTGSGTVPLRDTSASHCELHLTAEANSAAAIGSVPAVELLRLQVACDTTPMPTETTPTTAATHTPQAVKLVTPSGSPAMPPIRVRLEQLGLRTAGAVVQVGGGTFSRDPHQGQWKLTGLAGTIESADRAAPPGNPAGKPQRPFSGRLDLTANASGPTYVPPGRQWREVTQYQIVARPHDASIWPNDWPHSISLINEGSIRIANDVATLNDLAGQYAGDPIRIATARVPLPRDLSDLWRKQTRVEELAGSVTFHQPAPVYPNGIQGTLEDLNPVGTFTLGGSMLFRFVDPLPPGLRPTEFHGTISADGRAAFHVTSKRLPLTQLKGEAILDIGQAVVIKKTEAHCMDGVLVAEGKIIPGNWAWRSPGEKQPPMRFEGRGWLRDIDLHLLASGFGIEKKDELSNLFGRGFANVRFSGTGEGGDIPPARSLRAEGDAEIRGARLWDDPIIGRMAGDVAQRGSKKAGGGVLPMGNPISPDARSADAAAVFSVADGVVDLKSAALNSPSLGVHGGGTISFDKKLDLRLTAVPIGTLREQIRQAGVPIVGEVVGAVQDLLHGAAGMLVMQYHVTGPTTKPKTSLVPAPIVTSPATAAFGWMATDHPDGRLIDAVRPSTQGTPK